MKYSKHIENHVNSTKIPKIQAIFCSGWPILHQQSITSTKNFACANDVKMLRNKIWTTSDTFLILKMHKFVLPPQIP